MPLLSGMAAYVHDEKRPDNILDVQASLQLRVDELIWRTDFAATATALNTRHDQTGHDVVSVEASKFQNITFEQRQRVWEGGSVPVTPFDRVTNVVHPCCRASVQTLCSRTRHSARSCIA